MARRHPPLVLVLLLIVLGPVVLVSGGVWTKRAEGEVEGTVSEAPRPQQQQQMLEKMLSAVELGLKFLSQDYSTINLDGLFGMRIGQGQVLHAMKECKSSRSCPDSVQRRLEKIHDVIETAATAAMAYVKEGDPQYFSRFIKTVNSSYFLQYNPVTLTDLHLTPVGSNPSYDEESGDLCLSRLMGTMVEDNRKVKVCNVTQQCIDMMTAPGRSEYSVTHQLLYFIIAEKDHCIEETEQILGKKIKEVEHRFCGAIYNEAVKEVKHGRVDQLGQDLFLEQVLLCGSIGVENFLRPDWMKMVLSWQKPVGCFSLDSPQLMLIEETLSKYQENERKLLTDLKEEARMIEKQHSGGSPAPGTGRKLLRETVMADGCLSHKTGLGFGTLCLFTRYLVRQNYLQD